MKIVAPISQVTEIEPLALVGVNELYCGIVPPEWIDRFHVATANRRPSGNLSSYDELKRAIEAAHSHNISLSLVLNAQHYSAEGVDAATEIAQRFTEFGGDALIVSDLGLMSALTTALPGIRIHVSSVATCRNPAAAKLCRELGARRLILPRDVTLNEASVIAAEEPDIEVEAFILNDGCVFEEGACSTIHLPGRLGGPICLDTYARSHRRRGGGELSPTLKNRLNENDEAYRKWLWYRFSCGFSTSQSGMPYGPCGLCAIPTLRRRQIAAVKIAGREAPLSRKLASVKMVREIVDLDASGASDAEVSQYAMQLRPSHSHCATGYMCYYPEVLQNRELNRYIKYEVDKIPPPIVRSISKRSDALVVLEKY